MAQRETILRESLARHRATPPSTRLLLLLLLLLLPPNIEMFEDVAGMLENTDPDVLPNGVDAGLSIGFAKTFAVDAGVC